MLPDDVLVEIFDFCVDKDTSEDFKPFKSQSILEWITLAHVCRRWRSVVFQSPRRLNLRLLCTSETPARDTLDIWPPLPVIIHDSYRNVPGTSGVDNVIAALEHNDRICQIQLRCFSSSQLGYVTNSAAMQKPFPQLTHLRLGRLDLGGLGQIVPDTFLGGTAPRLRSLRLLYNVPFPGLPKLLSSATHLVYLGLYDIPPSGYIPPEAMATSLSALTSLEYLCLHFRLPRPAQEIRRPPLPPRTRSILSSLTFIVFKGASEYLEVILAQIDTPRLNGLRITFFYQTIFRTPQFFQFISRTPTLRAPEKGHIIFGSNAIIIRFPSQTSDYGVLSVEIPCSTSARQLSSLEQVCTSYFHPVSTLEDLYVLEALVSQLRWQNNVENTLWLDLLQPFTAVKNLYLCKKSVPRIAPALQELVGERTTDVFPTLENIFMEGLQPWTPLHKGLEKFVSARWLTSHPVAVSCWNRDLIQERQWEIYGL